MIIALEGLMGSGKSYEAVAYHILPTLLQGRKVVTNIPLKREIFAARYGFQMLDLIEVREDYLKEDGSFHVAFSDVNGFRDEWRHTINRRKALYVVDECHIPFSTARSEALHKLFIDASLSRRKGNDWILLTQSLDNIYKPILNLIEAVHYLKKRVTVGQFGSYYHFLYDRKTKGKKYITKNVRTYNPLYFDLYESHFDEPVDEAELNVSDFRMWKAFRPTIIMLIVLSVLVYLVYNFFKKDEKPAEVSNQAKVATQNTNEFGAKPSKEEFLTEYYKNNPKPVPVVPVEEPKQIKNANSNVREKGEHDKQYVKFHDGVRSNEVLNVAQVEQTIYEREPVSSYSSYKKAPLENYKIQVLGSLFNPETKQIEFSYGVWSASGTMSYYKLAELVKMNYNVMPVSDCMQLIDHPNISEPFYITCHQPTFEKSNNDDSGSLNGSSANTKNILKALDFK